VRVVGRKSENPRQIHHFHLSYTLIKMKLAAAVIAFAASANAFAPAATGNVS